MRATILVPALVLLHLAVAPAALALDKSSCLECHGDAWLLEGVKGADRLLITEESHLRSLHGASGIGCGDCHEDMAEGGFPHPRQPKPVDCGRCHQEISAEFSGSLHGYALKRGNTRAPSCKSCHGTHDIRSSSDLNSRTHKANVPKQCAECHGTAGLLTDEYVKLPESFRDYAESVHGKANQAGNTNAASCNDCHQVHALRNSEDPSSPIHKRNVASTCGRCHVDIRSEYDVSIHGRAVQAGVSDSPTCTDCHGEHLILSPKDPRSKTNATELAQKTCGRCHDDPIIIAKYSLEGGVVGSYSDSYHGWATRRGYRAAASCISCHTAHGVRPAKDPASSVHPANVVETCRRCHEDATPKFAQSYNHRTASIDANPVNAWIRSAYLALIALVIGSMVLHNVVIMNYYLAERRKEDKAARWVLRFDRSQVWQHLILSLAFIMLVITGFALRYPEAWWVRQLSAIGMSEPVRSVLHRVFAAMLVAVGLTHVWYVLLTRRGRGELMALAPNLQDVRDAVGNIRFHIWRSDRRVKFGRYDYTQKAEYWALIWGTFLMVATGAILWFPEFWVKYLPVWIVGAAQTVHFYEAWLATLAIVIWHFFFVIFHPEEYPMSWTWITGRMSERSARHHHGRWFEEESAKDASFVQPADHDAPPPGRHD